MWYIVVTCKDGKFTSNFVTNELKASDMNADLQMKFVDYHGQFLLFKHQCEIYRI